MTFILRALSHAHPLAGRTDPVKPALRGRLISWAQRRRSIPRKALRAKAAAAGFAALIACALGAVWWHGSRPMAIPPANRLIAAAKPAPPTLMAASQPAPAAPPRSATKAIVSKPAPPTVARFPEPTALTRPLPNPSPVQHRAWSPALPVAASETPPPEEVKALSALPADLQQTVGALQVRLLMRSPQRSRSFVMIGSRQWHEGEQLAAGVRLVEITSDGMILQAGGMRVLAPPVSVNEPQRPSSH